MFDKKIPLLDYHWSRIEYTAEVLAAQLPKRFTVESFQHMLLDLALVNDSVTNARVRLHFLEKVAACICPMMPNWVTPLA